MGLQPAAISAKIGERQKTGAVKQLHAVWRFFFIRHVVRKHFALNRDDFAGLSLRKSVKHRPVDPAFGQMQKQIPHVCAAGQLLKQRLHFRADARQGIERRKQGKQTLIAHGIIFNRASAAGQAWAMPLKCRAVESCLRTRDPPDGFMTLDERRRKLLFRAWRRGFREMDLITGNFAEQNLASFDETELDEFERLLAVPDWDVYAWLIGDKPVPDNYAGPVLDRLIAFRYGA